MTTTELAKLIRKEYEAYCGYMRGIDQEKAITHLDHWVWDICHDAGVSIEPPPSGAEEVATPCHGD